MKKVPYILCSLIVGITFIEHILFPTSVWGAILLLILTGLFYVISVMFKKTCFFHEYIGWGWIILPILVAPTVLLKRNTEWNVLALICIGLCAGIIFSYLWKMDNRNKGSYIALKGISICGLVTISILFLLISFNEILIVKVDFVEINVNEKYIYDVPRSTNEEYYVSAKEYENNKNSIFPVSKKYFDSIEVGDKIKLCVCTGALNVSFYFLYEDPEIDMFYLNDWAKLEAQAYQDT